MMRFLTSSPTALETEIELALRKNEPAIIHRENAADWVIMSSEMYDNLIEAVFLLKNPASTIHLKQSAARPLANQRKINSANWDDFFTAQKAAAAEGRYCLIITRPICGVARMRLYLLDTNIVTHAIKGHPAVTQHLQKTSSRVLRVSVITYAELMYGLARRPEAKH